MILKVAKMRGVWYNKSGFMDCVEPHKFPLSLGCWRSRGIFNSIDVKYNIGCLWLLQNCNQERRICALYSTLLNCLLCGYSSSIQYIRDRNNTHFQFFSNKSIHLQSIDLPYSDIHYYCIFLQASESDRCCIAFLFHILVEILLHFRLFYRLDILRFCLLQILCYILVHFRIDIRSDKTDNCIWNRK